jgi:SAM-dependent methyltransferase
VSSYVGRYAEFYDLIYADKPYASEIEFLDGQVQSRLGRRPARWLDVACGTGTHALCLAARGYDVLGVDYSRDQLLQAQHKARARNLKVAFEFADMRALDLGPARFDAISCLFDSIGYAKTNEAIVAALSGMKRHLSTTGLLMLEFWHAPAMLKHYEPFRTRTWPIPDGELVRTSESTLNIPAQTCSVRYTLNVKTKLEPLESFSETQENRFFLMQEMNLLLTSSGLTTLAAFAGYDALEPITDQTWHVVVLAGHSTA